MVSRSRNSPDFRPASPRGPRRCLRSSRRAIAASGRAVSSRICRSFPQPPEPRPRLNPTRSASVSPRSGRTNCRRARLLTFSTKSRLCSPGKAEMNRRAEHTGPLIDKAALERSFGGLVAGSAVRPSIVSILKDALASARAEAERRLLADGHGTKCATSLSEAQDEIIRALFDFARLKLYPAANPTQSERISIVAVGGYGRGTLAPGSDIDLLFLLPYKETAWSESIVEFMLYSLWDTRLKVGHATRSVEDSIRLAQSDSTILTSILEARYICGDRTLFDDLIARFRKAVAGEAKQFIATKLAERDERHFKSGESRYVVEPDV